MQMIKVKEGSFEDGLKKFIPYFSQMRYPSMLTQLHLWHPPTDVLETPSEILVLCELAGIKRDEIAIILDKNYLIIKGERNETLIPTEAIYHNLEIFYGPFERVLRLPNDVNVTAVKASYKDGFLLVRLVKVETPQKNEVKSKSSREIRIE